MAADALTISRTCATFADEMQSEDIVILDLRGISTIADFFVICSGTSVPHLKAISREIREGTAREIGEKHRAADGEARSMWMVIDYVDVVVHILHEEMRARYALEELWGDAPRVALDFLPDRGKVGEATAAP